MSTIVGYWASKETPQLPSPIEGSLPASDKEKFLSGLRAKETRAFRKLLNSPASEFFNF